MLRTGMPLAAICALVLSGCERTETRAEQPKAVAVKIAPEINDESACAKFVDGAQLKDLVFKGAREVRTDKPEMLDRLAKAVVVRVEDPRFRNRNEALDATICKARLVMELPPGAKDPFNASARLAAEIAFAVQGRAKKDRPIYLIDGAEPIIYRLAAMEPEGIAQPIVTTLAVARAAQPPVAKRTAVAARVEPALAWQTAEPRRPGRGRPSFDCRFARTRSQRMICADERLAAYDRVMAPLYEDAVDRTNRRTQRRLRASQSRFEAARDRCGGPACIAKAYQERMNEIDAIVAAR
jgi:uncharacterized protein YecT (DUF1311 family)